MIKHTVQHSAIPGDAIVDRQTKNIELELTMQVARVVWVCRGAGTRLARDRLLARLLLRILLVAVDELAGAAREVGDGVHGGKIACKDKGFVSQCVPECLNV